MLSKFFLCLSFVVYGIALNQAGNITPHSNARCSIRHLGMGLGGQNFCSNLMDNTANVANPSLVRVPQRKARCSLRHLGVGFSGQYIGEKLWRRQRILTTFLVPMSLNDTWYICAVCRHLGAPWSREGILPTFLVPDSLWDVCVRVCVGNMGNP